MCSLGVDADRQVSISLFSISVQWQHEHETFILRSFLPYLVLKHQQKQKDELLLLCIYIVNWFVVVIILVIVIVIVRTEASVPTTVSFLRPNALRRLNKHRLHIERYLNMDRCMRQQDKCEENHCVSYICNIWLVDQYLRYLIVWAIFEYGPRCMRLQDKSWGKQILCEVIQRRKGPA